jgi:hypothetical protein
VIAMAALIIAVLALVLSNIGVLAFFAWRRDRQRYEALAERINVDARLEYLTTQTLGAMRDAVRGQYRNERQF